MSSDLRTSRSAPTPRSRVDSESFTDASEMHKAGRSGNSALIKEYVKISESPEDPERTPDIPEDLEQAPLSRGKTPNLGGGKGPGKSKTYVLACVGGVAILMIGLAIVFTSSRQPGGVAASYLNDQVRGAVHKNVIQTPGRLQSDALGDTDEMDRGLQTRQGTPAASSTSSVPQTVAEATRMAGRPLAFERDGKFCNASVPIPKPVLRTWDLPDGLKRVCEFKNVKEKFSAERNWCWVGMNQMCHWNLKMHFSWSKFQDMASGEGMCPAREDHPFSPIEDPELCDRPENGRVREWTEGEWGAARRWFKDHVAVYVLSLFGLGDHRWHMMKQRLDELQIWATRLPGVDMRVPGALDAAKRQGWVPQTFNFSKAQKTAYESKHDMGSILGTVGCASAHFKAQSKAIADGSPLAIIMEDDSYLTEDFVPRVWSLVREELPCDWEVTALLSRCGYGRCVSPRLMRVMPDANEPAWRCRQGSNWGMHAVLYNIARLPKLQKLWQKTVFNEDRPHCMDIDVGLASISDIASFYAVPAVQDPGFLKENNHRSARWDINQAASSTTTTAAKTSTTGFFVPTIKPGEPWPGAWNFG